MEVFIPSRRRLPSCVSDSCPTKMPQYTITFPQAEPGAVPGDTLINLGTKHIPNFSKSELNCPIDISLVNISVVLQCNREIEVR